MEYHSSGSLPLLGRPRYCPGANANGGYLCETGHCCGESGCCTYYYELWWFWLLWTVLILFSCCCAYRHRRAKLRVQQQQRQRDISLLAYQGASSFPSSMLDLSFLASLKLPSYEEVAAQPSTPPPPYSSVFTAPQYPQPPRTMDPHLLTQQHPGTLLHRPLQPLSDGPSSLSSDNSSSCSCDSCCPSSPCSSSLSAPVTYETDTSHTSTPSEATPLTLDSVTIETITAAATRLDKGDSSALVAILIDEKPLAAAACAPAPAATCSTTPLETIASPVSDSTFPVGITLPIKQQLDIQPNTTNPTSCSESTENSKSSSPTTSPPASLNLLRTFDSTTSQEQPRTLNLILDSIGGNTDKNPSLVPISISPQNPTLPILSNETCSSISDSKNPKLTSETTPNTSPTRTLHLLDTLTTPDKLTICNDEVATNSHHSPIPSPPSQGTSHFSTQPADESSESNATETNITSQHERETPTPSKEAVENHEDISESCIQAAELVKLTEMVAMNVDQKSENVDTSTLKNSGLLQAPNTFLEFISSCPETPDKLDCAQKLEIVTQTTNPLPIIEMKTLTLKPRSPVVDSKIHSPTVSQICEIATTFPENTNGCVSISFPDHSISDCPVLLLPQEVASNETSCQEDIASRFYTEDPSCNSKDLPSSFEIAKFPADEKTLSKSLPTEYPSSFSVPHSHSLNLEQSFANSPAENPTSSFACPFFPAITIQTDLPLYTTSPTSPCSIPSPSLPSPPVSMLLLDPLSALQPSEKSAVSSGHASSLSPSPRNTQSPPKQTLFSPCVDIFEPVNANWDDEESEEQGDEEYCEDSDVAADESQYKHRRLTGDSGIEVCRCRIEDEDEEDDDKEDLKPDIGKDGSEKKLYVGSSELHDSLDCPVRSQKSAAEDVDLCNTEMKGSDEKAAIPVETV
ncbi:unnamed protein product [Knipowitschia caucasica]